MVNEAVCPQCGTRYYGWALNSPRYQRCTECGSALKIKEGVGVKRDDGRLQGRDIRLFFDQSGKTIRDRAERISVKVIFSMN